MGGPGRTTRSALPVRRASRAASSSRRRGRSWGAGGGARARAGAQRLPRGQLVQEARAQLGVGGERALPLRRHDGDDGRLRRAGPERDDQGGGEEERGSEGPEYGARFPEEEAQARQGQLPERGADGCGRRARTRGVHSRSRLPVRCTNTSSRVAWWVERRVRPKGSARARIAGKAT